MRGKDGEGNDEPRMIRITPAYAGKSIEERNPSDYVLGSPPPMRGKGHNSKILEIQNRITPAYAGKSKNAGIIYG